MTWNEQQSKALQGVFDWYKSPSAPQVYKLFGWAGTGKTTLAKEIAGEIKAGGGKVLFAAFTGKATLVLRRKGNPASTIHSLIYEVEEEDGELHFYLNPNSSLCDATCLIVDEVSMVNEELGDDLLSFGVKILVLGDPFQLPPVSGQGFFTQGEPDFMITDIRRQAKENPIIQLATDVREGKQLKPGAYGESEIISRRKIQPKSHIPHIASTHDQVLCGTNATRKRLNGQLREIYGYHRDYPEEEEKLICLKNNPKKGLLNGSLWDVQEVYDPERFRVHSPDLNLSVDIDVPSAFFLGDYEQIPREELKDYDEFTYGYALTTHKAQGSQWDDVFILDESFVFRQNAGRHLYTAITRAAERVTIVL